MFTLSSVTEETRTILKWGGIGIGALIVLFLVIKIIVGIIQSAQPPPPPTVAFGKLPHVAVLERPSGKNLVYNVNTLTGQLPATSEKPANGQFPDRLPVFKIVQPKTNILALQNVTKEVAAAGFTAPPVQISDTLYKWTDTSEVNRALVFNILTSDFQLTSSYMSDPLVQLANNLSTEANAKAAAQTFLTSMQLFPDDIDTTKTKTALYSLSNGTLISATSLSNAQIIRVDFFQKDITYDGYSSPLPIYYQTAPNSPMNFLVGGGQYNVQVVGGNWMHESLDPDSSGTYPIKTAAKALDELKNGGGFIAIAPLNSQNVNIDTVTLGYFLGNDPQLYAMPIIVFQGKDFLAYVSAVTDAALQN